MTNDEPINVDARIWTLKRYAEDCGCAVSAASEEDLLVFLGGYASATRPYIVLLDNGNLRAIWKNEAGEQIGIQFRGERRVQYVLLTRGKETDSMDRVSGRGGFVGVKRWIDFLNLGHLITGGTVQTSRAWY